MSEKAVPLDYPAGDGSTRCRGVYYLPGTAAGALPITAAGTLPITAAGALPGTAAGALPGTATGALPGAAGGALPGDTAGPLPVVLVTHAWDGLVQEVHDKARRLAAQGYIAFAIDIYGEGRTESDPARLMATLEPWLSDRALLLARMRAALDAAQRIPEADPARIGAIGYCFGGLAALDLARGSDALRAVVSFHGDLRGNGLEQTAPIGASVLALHGEDDPLVPPDVVAAFKAEMDARGADWTLVSYGGTLHGFTRPGANNPDFGTLYSARAEARSWRAMCDFFRETL